MIELHVHSPAVPSIDLLDLPGLKAAPGPRDAADMPQQVEALVRSQIEQHKDSAVFLVTIDASMKSEASLGTKLIVEYGLQPRTIGVLTKCDDLGRTSMKALPARLRQTDEGTKLEPHGCVATVTYRYVPLHTVTYRYICRYIPFHLSSHTVTYRDYEPAQVRRNHDGAIGGRHRQEPHRAAAAVGTGRSRILRGAAGAPADGRARPCDVQRGALHFHSSS